MTPCEIRDATHISTDGRDRVRIASKWGIRDDGSLAPPSAGGYGVVTESGERLDMWLVHSYWRE